MGPNPALSSEELRRLLAVECLCRRSAAGPNALKIKSLPWILSATEDLNFISTLGDGLSPLTMYRPICCLISFTVKGQDGAILIDEDLDALRDIHRNSLTAKLEGSES